MRCVFVRFVYVRVVILVLFGAVFLMWGCSQAELVMMCVVSWCGVMCVVL